MQAEVGRKLPKADVNKKGEIILSNGKTDYRKWSTSELKDKVFLIQHIAGKTGAKALNASLIEAIKSVRFPKEQYQTVTIINLNDVIWGTRAIVTGKAELAKKEYPKSMFVLDSTGAVRETWNLQPDSSAIILVDQQGKVLFCKDGKLSKDEISDLISYIDAALDHPICRAPNHTEELVPEPG